jgi:prepilin-type N-terminal cleavage/methylation domain-containing protein
MPTGRKQGGMRRQGLKRKGFSLVEILVVVMVVMIIAAIAIPSLLHARMKANEAAAVASIKTIQTAETLYANTYPDVGYTGSLPNLGNHGTACEKPTSTNACIIMDEALTSGLKNGYIFEVINDGNKPSMSYTATATPESDATGHCIVQSGQSGELHFSVAGSTSAGARSLGSASSGGCD